MARPQKILLDNAWVSWANAIFYCDQILAGKLTLEIRKNFVSSLHNAIELFIKQIMLDKCDYRVAESRKIDADGEPAKSFYAANDLNAFFDHLDYATRKKFVSIEFNTFYDLHKEILQNFLQPGDSYKNELRLINELRNNETHFYIGRDEYLAEAEFLQIYNFMTEFYQVLHEYELLPFWGEAWDEYRKLDFERDPLHSFSYKDTVKKSAMAKQIKSAVSEMVFQDSGPVTAYEMTCAIASSMPDFTSNQFDNLWAYVEVLEQFGMIELVQIDEIEEENPEYGHDYAALPTIPHAIYALKVNF